MLNSRFFRFDRVVCAAVFLAGLAMGNTAHSAPAPDGSRDASLYAACVEVPGAVPMTFVAECQTWMAMHSTYPLQGQTLDGVVADYLSGVRQSGNCTQKGKAKKGKKGGQTVHSLRLNCGPEQAAPTSLIKIAWTGEDPVQISACTTAISLPGSKKQCDAVVDDLVVHGPPKGLSTAGAPGTLQILGRPVQVPAECQVDQNPAGATIECAQSKQLLNWVLISEPTTEEHLSQVSSQFQQQLSQGRPGGTWVVTVDQCTVEGAAGRCWRFEGAYPDREELIISVLGFAQVGQTGLLVSCTYTGNKDAAVPPMCEDVFKTSD